MGKKVRDTCFQCIGMSCRPKKFIPFALHSRASKKQKNMPHFAHFPPYTITKKKCLRNGTHLLHTQYHPSLLSRICDQRWDLSLPSIMLEQCFIFARGVNPESNIFSRIIKTESSLINSCFFPKWQIICTSQLIFFNLLYIHEKINNKELELVEILWVPLQVARGTRLKSVTPVTQVRHVCLYIGVQIFIAYGFTRGSTRGPRGPKTRPNWY